MAPTPIYQVKAEFFKTLAHPARIRVLELLRDGDRTVGDLIPEVGIEASHLSQQLGIMRRANLVQSRKEGATARSISPSSVTTGPSEMNRPPETG